MGKVLFVSGQEFILNQKDGGRKCAFRYFSMLKDVYGCENVYTWIFTNEFVESDNGIHREKSHSSVIRKIFNVLALRSFYSHAQEEKLFQYIVNNKFDLVCFERSMFGPLVKKLNKQGIKTQIFLENIEKNYVWNKVKYQNICFLLPYISTKYNEKMTLKYADDIICLTDRDAAELHKIYQRDCSAIIPMTFDDHFPGKEAFLAEKSGQKKMLFVGTNFLPNYQGIKWFVNNVMNYLHEYQLVIVGKGFENRREELQRHNVQVVGTVDNLSSFYCSNMAMVMPILFGDGIKVKTAEAMMYGKMIFATDEALQGYNTDGVEGIYRCNTAEEYIDTINKVFELYDNVGYVENVRAKFLNEYESTNATKIYRMAFLKNVD